MVDGAPSGATDTLSSEAVPHFLGVPVRDRRKFADWTEVIVEANANADPLAAGARLTELLTYFSDLLQWRRSAPGEDLLSMLIEREADTAEVPFEQILGFAFTMVAGGNDTVTAMVAGSAALLAAHPGQRAVLTRSPTIEAARFEELFRMVCRVKGLARTTTVDVEFEVDEMCGEFAPGNYVRRYARLPLRPGSRRT